MLTWAKTIWFYKTTELLNNSDSIRRISVVEAQQRQLW